MSLVTSHLKWHLWHFKCSSEWCIQGLVHICSSNQNTFWNLITKGKSCYFFTHSRLCSDRLLYAALVSIAQQRAAESALKPFNVKRYSENIPAGHCRHCRWERSIRSKGQNLLKKGENCIIIRSAHTHTFTVVKGHIAFNTWLLNAICFT